MITVSALNEISRVRHGFFTRNHGYSTGIYQSMNCGYGSGDDPDTVTRNRERAMAEIDQPLEALVTLNQQHTSDVITVTERWSIDQAPVADAWSPIRKESFWAS